MGLGQVVDLLDALAEPAAEDAARADADQRLHVLEPGAERVVPGVEEGEQALAPVRRRPGREGAETDDDPVCGAERRQGRPRHEQHRADHDDDDDHGAEVGLDEDEQAEQADERADGAREILERPRRRPAGEVGGAPDDERELGELRRLERHRAEADPAARAVDPLAEHEHRGAQDERGHDEGRREGAQLAEVGAGGGDEQGDAHERVRGLALEVARRVGVSESRGRRGRAVDHHEAEGGEPERDEHEELPFEEVPGRRTAHASSSARRRKASPRCSKFSNWS